MTDQAPKIIPIIPISQVVEFKKPSVPADVTKAVLETKRPSIAEIELTLFENCNIECDFCFHDKKSTVGLTRDEMQEKLDHVERFFEERAHTVDLMQINMVGGELFQDRWMERLCDDYFYISWQIHNLAYRYKVPLKIVWVSNFLFAKKEVVRDLIDKLRNSGVDSHLIVSYDFDGRPMSNRYRDNIEWFGPEYICSVNLVGTVSSIKEFMKDEDDYFKWLYEIFNVYFDDFIPDKGSDDEIPSDSLTYEWYKFIADHYPKINPVRTLLENEKNEMHCLSLNKLTIFPDNRTSNCRWHRYDQGDFNTEFDIHNNAGMMQNYLEENQCLSCEYFNRCGFRCFTQWDWRNRNKDMNMCMMKAFFNYITKGVEWKREK